MYDRYHFSYNDWRGQGDLRRVLCTMEMSVRCGQELYQAITQYSGIEYYADLGDQVAMVIGDHGLTNRKRERTAPAPVLCSRLKDLLRNDFIKAIALRNPLFIDDNGKIEPSSYRINGQDDSGQTVIVDADLGIIFLLEAGYQYIRLVTTYPFGCDKFHVRKGARVIKVNHDVLTTKLDNIPEVDFQDRWPDYNGTESKE